MQYWDLRTVDAQPSQPLILSTTDEGRTIALDLRSREEMQEHQVHERAWLVVANGEVDVSSAAGARVSGGPGYLFEFAPQERHTVRARSDTRLLLLLAPWPGEGHPGAMTLDEKDASRQKAAERAQR